MRTALRALLGAATLLASVATANAQTDGFTSMTFDGFHLTAPDGWRIAPQDEHLPMIFLFPEGSGERPDRIAMVGIEKLYPDPDSLGVTVALSAEIFDATLVSTHPVALTHGDGLAGVFENDAGQIGVVAFRRLAVPGRFDPRDLDVVVMVYETGILNEEAFVPTRTPDELIPGGIRIADGFSIDG